MQSPALTAANPPCYSHSEVTNMLLYIIRHGYPDYETDSLTELGWQQAEAVGKRLAKSKIDRIYTSPMGRARQTAEPLCRLLGKEYQVEQWCHEIDDSQYTTYPDGERKPLCSMQSTIFRGPEDVDRPFDDTFNCPAVALSGMQAKYEYIRKSGDEFLEKLGYKHEHGNTYRILRPNQEKVAVFCHALFGMTWISALLHIPFHMMWSGFCYSHTGVTIIELENNEDGFTSPKCLSYCDLSHIYAEGLPMLYDNWNPI